MVEFRFKDMERVERLLIDDGFVINSSTEETAYVVKTIVSPDMPRAVGTIYRGRLSAYYGNVSSECGSRFRKALEKYDPTVQEQVWGADPKPK